jgi:hypothetical protein
MPIIDINVRFGAYPSRHRTVSFEQVSSDAAKLGAEKLCACSTTGIFYNDGEGNTETLAAAAAQPGRLVPVATLNPANAIDTAKSIEAIMRAPFAMMRFFPNDQGWPIDFAPFAQCLNLLAEKSMPVLTTCTRLGDATMLARMMQSATDGRLPVILEGVSSSNLAEVIAAMRDCPRLYVETHAIVFAGGLRMIRDAVGAERIVFGSGASALSLGAALSYVNGSDLSDDEKAGVLGGNAARLLNL